MKKLETVFYIIIIAIFCFSVHTSKKAYDERERELSVLQDQVKQLNTELTAIKHQQLLNNAVTEDLSNRVGWR